MCLSIYVLNIVYAYMMPAHPCMRIHEYLRIYIHVCFCTNVLSTDVLECRLYIYIYIYIFVYMCARALKRGGLVLIDSLRVWSISNMLPMTFPSHVSIHFTNRNSLISFASRLTFEPSNLYRLSSRSQLPVLGTRATSWP